MRPLLRRFLKRLYLLKKNLKHSHRVKRNEEREKRRREVRNVKKRLRHDLSTGHILKEILISPEDLYLLNSDPSISQLLNLSYKYRGFKSGEHPSIYRKPVNKKDI